METKVTEFGLQMLKERYFYGDEKVPEDLFKRVAEANADDLAHSVRLQEYLRNLWFMGATPVLSNSGLPERGAVISCFLNEVPDSKEGIFGKFDENFWLGSGGGGIGTDWTAVREIGHKVGANGKSSGVIPFMKVSDSSTLAVSQGGLRRASQAVYLDISHPEIEEFIDLRKPTGGDTNRRCLNIHHGVKISDKFMEAVLAEDTWDLVSPKDGSVVKTVDAFDLFAKVITARMELGEPYIFFSDAAERMMPEVYKLKGMTVSMSNLCTEIMLATSPESTAVCCLASLNLETYDEWKDNKQFIPDVIRFLDNVLQAFIDFAKGREGYEAAVHSAEYERSIGLGVMGFHGYLMAHSIPFESSLATSFNRQVFEKIDREVKEASLALGFEKGFAPIYKGTLGKAYRNVCKTAIAPTSSISIICGEATAGIEPIAGNIYPHKNNLGTHIVRNKYLVKLLKEKQEEKLETDEWYEAQWSQIVKDKGSVKNLECLTDWEKDVFKTAFEIDQRWVIEHAAVRQPSIEQGQSVNLFIYPDAHKLYIFNLHVMAWKKGLKSLYYCRSQATTRADITSEAKREAITVVNYDECLSCQ